MLTFAGGLPSNPSSSFLSSRINFGIGHVRRSSPTGNHIIMSLISYHYNFSTAATSPHACWLARSHGNRRTEKVCNAIRSRNVTFLFSREGSLAAHIRCRSNFLCSNRFALPTGCSSGQSGFGIEQTGVTSNQGFFNWSTSNRLPSLNSHGFRSSSVSRIGDAGVETRYGLGSTSKFHTAARQEGRYISASAQEEHVRFETLEEDGLEIENDNGIDRNGGRGIEKVGISAGEVEKQGCAPEMWVVNFYYFVSIEDPHFEVARHTSFLEAKDVRCRIYISHQGINAQLSGPRKEAIEYAEWVKEDSRFSDMLVQISPSPGGHAFPRLRLRYKPSLVQVEGGTLHLPITDPSARAVHLSPRDWTQRLDASILSGENSSAVSQVPGSLQDGQDDDTLRARKPVVLLDVRNGYEWDVGHFKGAQRPNVDCFKSTEFGLTENETVSSDPLANVDKEAVDVMMYCTGGIRCDVFSTMLSSKQTTRASFNSVEEIGRLAAVDKIPEKSYIRCAQDWLFTSIPRQKGFKNLYTLKGGVSNYLKEEGARKWAGNLFVFDSRLAVPPKDYHMKESSNQEVLSESDTTEEEDCANSSATQVFARCRLCGDPITEPRHRNCANLDCNLLYMSCEDCLSQHKGCCSTGCSTAPRLRPLLAVHQYDRWHKYRSEEPKPPKPADYVSRRALKRRRRKERRKLLEGDTVNEQLTLKILESHVPVTEVHDEEPKFATISEGQ